MTLETTIDTGVRQAAVFQRFEKFEHNFVGVNKMVPTGHSERCVEINTGACKLETRIAETFVELLEA